MRNIPLFRGASVLSETSRMKDSAMLRSPFLFPEPLPADQPLLYRESGEKAYILLNRPGRCNAFSLPLLEEFRRRLISLEGRNDLRAVLIAGTGNHFSSGLDLAEAVRKETVSVDLADPFPLTVLLIEKGFDFFSGRRKGGTVCGVPCGFRMPWLVAEIFLRLAALPQVVIAAGRGSACGGGGGLLASCDIVLAEPSIRFGFPECRRGIAPTLLHPFLERRVPSRGLYPALLTGSAVGASEALRLGLVDRLVSDGEAAERAEQTADEVLAGDRERVRETKRIFRAPDRAFFEEAADGLARHWESWNEPSAAEGVAAFLEKRIPRR